MSYTFNMDPLIFYIFLAFAGYIVGLGAVTVIDSLGFFARKNSYWTETTIRAHKITKPLIWLGICLKLLGEFLLYQTLGFPDISILLFVISGFLIANGFVLSFYISPDLLKREKEGRATELLPAKLQNLITVSFIVSFLGWWGSVFISSWLIYSVIF